MLGTFMLSNVIGIQAVLGVTHALHSPLMAVTNAISGSTVLGGLHLLAHAENSGSVYGLAGKNAFESNVNIL